MHTSPSLKTAELPWQWPTIEHHSLLVLTSDKTPRMKIVLQMIPVFVSVRHYHLFPKSLGEVIERFSVQELHLTQTQGMWRHEKWGYPVEDSAPGAELAVWFQAHTRKYVLPEWNVDASQNPHWSFKCHRMLSICCSVDDQWTDLINVLSGMFCASLNFMDSKATVSPKYSFRPHGAANEGQISLSISALALKTKPSHHGTSLFLLPAHIVNFC